MSAHFTPEPEWPSIVELATELWGQPTHRTRDEVHFGSKASKKVWPAKHTWFDHEAHQGGGYVELHRLARGELPPRPKPEPKQEANGKLPPWQDIARIYDYTDAAENLVLQVIRTISGNPRFRQRRPNGQGGWIWEVKTLADRPLYRLPGLRNSGDETVWICEGEKDVDLLTGEGLIATSNIGGAGKWRAEYAEEFRGKHCVVLQDNDEPGRKHATDVMRSLVGIAASVRVLMLPDLPLKGDVSDWLDADGNTVDELRRLAREANDNIPSEPKLSDHKPVLRLSYGAETMRPEPMGTVVQGLLHAGSVSLIYGPPKSGKSFLATDLALSIAAKDYDWMGHRIVRPGPVLYVTCEGHAGFWKRNTAAARKRGWDDASFPREFILAKGRPMLIRAEQRGLSYAPDPSSILTALEDAKRDRGLVPVAIIIDTVFRSFGVGNVNDSQDMNVYLAAIATFSDKGYAVALVHHEIKSGGTPAGSVSLIGGSDNIIHVWRETETSSRRFWQVEMAKDDAESEPRAFTLEVCNLGLDREDQPASSCVVCDEGNAPDAGKKKRGRPPSQESDAAILANLIYTELCNLLADQREGQEVCIAPGAPPIRAVSRTRLRGAINLAGILDPLPDGPDRKRVQNNNDRDVKRAINRLKNQRKTAANEQWIGIVP